MKLENTKAQMRRGVLELCVLSIIKNSGESYPSEILTRLKEVELLVVEGTLYPLLTRLKNEKYLDYKWVESTGGPPRKYYKLSTTGEELLKELLGSWQQLGESIDKITQ